MDNIIYTFTKNRKGQSNGCVVAATFPTKEGYVFVTGSLCHKGKDKFSKEDALNLAKERAYTMAHKDRSGAVAYSLWQEIEHMCDRASLYFKDCKVIRPEIKSCDSPCLDMNA
jgi:hypothetical protein